MIHFRYFFGLLALAFAWRVARADIVTYTIDPTRSSLTISGTYEGDPLQPQTGVPDGLTTSYAGTITANRDFSGDTLQITGGTIAAQSNAELGSTNDYGLFRPAGIDTDVLFEGAVAGLSFSASGPAIDFPSSFNASILSVDVSSGTINYSTRVGGGGSGGTVSTSGIIALEPNLATLIEAAGIETLTIPIETSTPVIFTASDGTTFPLDVNFSGNIVAISLVPEPGSLVMLVIPAALLALHKS